MFWTKFLLTLNVCLIFTQVVNGRHIIVLRDGIGKEGLNNFVADVRQADEDPSLPDVHCTIHDVVDTLCNAVVVTASKRALRKISKMQEVSFIERDKLVRGASRDHLSWALDRLDQRWLPLDQYYQPTGTGAGVDVYVVDSGINYSHKEFQGRAFFTGFDRVPGENKSRSGSDCHGHGTHVASVIGGRKYGVAKNVTLYSARVINCYRQGYVSDLFNALRLVAQRIIHNRRPAVINLSLITGRSPYIDGAMETLYKWGIPVVAGAGNGGNDACNYSPANSKYVLTVAVSSSDDTPYLTRSGTNFGRCVDIFAPGENVLGASLRCNHCSKTSSGSSMATAIVSGVLALYLEREPSLTVQQLFDKVLNDSTNGVIDMTVDGVPGQLKNQTTTKLVNVGARCGGERVVHQQGLLWSPNFPNHYPDNLTCTWRIIGQPGEIIKLTIEELDLLGNDTLVIFDGNSTDLMSSVVLAELTGKIAVQNTLQSHNHSVTVVLSTDGDYSGKGFWLKYRKCLIVDSSTSSPTNSSVINDMATHE